MIVWIILEVALISLSIAALALSLSPIIAVVCLVTALVPGYFIFQAVRQKRLRLKKKIHKKATRHRFVKSRGKVLYFPEGGRRKSGTHKHY